jgi:ABC-type transporter Mla MlaB component
MLLRITRAEEGGMTRLVVEGGLRAAHVHVLAEECESTEGSLVLDLTKLCSVDTAGMALLKELAASGVEMRGMSTSIRMRIQHHPPLNLQSSVA